MWKAKNKSVDNKSITTTKKTVKTADSNVKEMEDDLNAVSEGDFNVDNLSDENLGL